MSTLDVPTVAGIASTVIFAGGTLPMLVKARRSRNLASYSLGNIALANVGNVVHSAYVFSLPPGPIWLLHSFYLVSSGLMLGWYVRYASASITPAAAGRNAQIARRGGGSRIPSVPSSELGGEP
jgi:hypothetical protein